MRDRRLRRPGSSADSTPRSVPSAHTSASAGGTRLLRWPDASGCPVRLPRPVVDVRDRDVAGPAATGRQDTHGPRDRPRPPAGLRRTGTRVSSPTPPRHAVQRRRHRCWVWSTGRSRPTAVPWERPAACPGASAHGAGAPLPVRVVGPGRLRRAGPPPGPPVRPGPGRRRLSRPSGFDDAREDARALVTARPTSVRPLSVRGERRLRSPGSSSARRPPGGAPTGPRPRGAACLPRAGTTALRRSGRDGDEAVGAGTAGGTGPDRAGWQPDDATAGVSGPRASGDRQRAGGSRGPHAGPAVAVPQPPEPDLAAAGGADTARAPVGRPDPAAPPPLPPGRARGTGGAHGGWGALHAPLGRRCRPSAVRCRPADSAGTVRAREDGTGRSRGRPPVRGGAAGDVGDHAPPHPSRLPRSDRWRSPPA